LLAHQWILNAAHPPSAAPAKEKLAESRMK
jgi:hypothetical protein